MRLSFRLLTRLAAFSTLLPVAAALAAPGTKLPKGDPEPEVVKTATGTVEVGTLGGVPYRIDVPAKWNHALVMYFHGYMEGPTTYRTTSPLNEQTGPLVERGYAVAQSAYSVSGWALAEAFRENETLRLYFVKRYGQPVEGKAAAKTMETIVAGGSMGGALVVATLEQNPKPYSGGLDLCGSVGPTDLAFQRRFAWRAAFDFYFPGIMPPLDPVPFDYHESAALRLRAMDAMRGNPAGAAAMRGLTGLRSDREVADAMSYFTYVLADMQHKAGGNPFDNRNFLYTGTNAVSSASDNALNDGVRRYAGDLKARDYLLHHYTPTGRLSHPMLALHTTYDPRIPGSTLTIYAEQVAIAGFEDNLVQQYVRRDGHCAFSPEEVGRTFDELVTWIHTGKRPLPGDLQAATNRSGGVVER